MCAMLSGSGTVSMQLSNMLTRYRVRACHCIAHADSCQWLRVIDAKPMPEAVAARTQTRHGEEMREGIKKDKRCK